MSWSIHYHHGGVAGLRSVGTLQLAVKEACVLLDGGAEIGGIEGDGGLKGMGADEIMRLYAARKAKKSNGRTTGLGSKEA
jgi:hypothetical protein